MAKLKLVAEPTFKAKVGIPIAGGDSVEVEMTFKHRTRKEWDAWIAASKAKEDQPPSDDANVDAFMDVVVGWELEEEFTRQNVALLLQNYYGAGIAAISAYSTELWSAKLKNSGR